MYYLFHAIYTHDFSTLVRCECPDIPTHDVLDRLQTSMYNTERVVDVYLGKEGFSTYLDGMPYAMLNGWLGSVPYQSGMTYGDLKSS